MADAVELLKGIHSVLLKLLGSAELEQASDEHLGFLSLPLPSPEIKDTVLLTLCGTYLSYTTATTTHVLFSDTYLSRVPSSDSNEARDRAISSSITSLLFSPATLLAWHPSLGASITSKQADALMNRSYSSLIKSSASFSSDFPRVVFNLRHFALLCLLQTEILQADAFWEQCSRFYASLFSRTGGAKRASSSTVDKRTESDDMWVLSTFQRIVDNAQQRKDAGYFVGGKGFSSFCECWLDFAARVSHFKYHISLR
jgi:hypothetical protein